MKRTVVATGLVGIATLFACGAETPTSARPPTAAPTAGGAEEPVGARPEAKAEPNGPSFRVTELCTDYATCAAQCAAGEGMNCLEAYSLAPSDALKVKALKQGCDLRNQPACGALGLALTTGQLGVAKDRVAGTKLVTQACESAIPDPGTHKIMKLLGTACLEAGRQNYLAEDGKKALPLFDRGCPTELAACRGAAAVLEKGMGMPIDAVRADEYLQKGCAAGDVALCKTPAATSPSVGAGRPPSGAVEPAAAGAPVPRSIPAGSGWVCFTTELPHLECERTAARCKTRFDATRKYFIDNGDPADAVDASIGPCRSVAPWCVSLKDGTLRCYPQKSVCVSSRPKDASGCAAIP